ncbi:ATP-binding protein [Streptomyces monticola]|uniref:ATP-binding protein n=1 Tax=Streptomyces monticola TaxID=2666263 RepID=A0ABW2JFI5_9ACTN
MAPDESRAGNLPVPRSRLVGRRSELAHIARECGRSRLVTLTGTGGVGKSRLALQTAVELQPQFGDGAWLVELSSLKKGEVLPHVIAEVLPLADQTTRPMIDVVAEYLSGRELLLVLDTCETEACALTVEALLRAAPGLRVLTTSRRPLGMFAEQVFAVEPLPVPADGDPAAGTADAVVLLADGPPARCPVSPSPTPTGTMSFVCPAAWRYCRSRSNWPLPGCRSCPWPSWRTASRTASPSSATPWVSAVAYGICGMHRICMTYPHGIRPCVRRSAGAINCAPRRSGCCGRACRCSRAASTPRRHGRCVAVSICPRIKSWTCWPRSSASRS